MSNIIKKIKQLTLFSFFLNSFFLFLNSLFLILYSFFLIHIFSPLIQFKRKLNSYFLIHNSYQGSALIITILVIAVVSAIGFSVSRLTISQMRQTTQLEDSVKAYYAAESGIEQGLLMWRYNHNVEVPKENLSQDDPQTMRVFMNDMSTKDANISQPEPNVSNIPYYDLRIWYKNPIINGWSDEIVCSENATSSYCTNPEENQPITRTGTEPALAKDSAIQYNLQGIDRIWLSWEFEDDSYCRTNCRGVDGSPTSCNANYSNSICMLEFIPINEQGDMDWEQKNIFTYDDKFELSYPIDNIQTVRFRVFGNGLKEYRISKQATSSDDVKMSSGYTIIESTGYFGNAKRRLQIKINRTSRTILGPYDMVIYQAK